MYAVTSECSHYKNYPLIYNVGNIMYAGMYVVQRLTVISLCVFFFTLIHTN